MISGMVLRVMFFGGMAAGFIVGFLSCISIIFVCTKIIDIMIIEMIDKKNRLKKKIGYE